MHYDDAIYRDEITIQGQAVRNDQRAGARSDNVIPFPGAAPSPLPWKWIVGGLILYFLVRKK
jgi:hypothetical protein